MLLNLWSSMKRSSASELDHFYLRICSKSWCKSIMEIHQNMKNKAINLLAWQLIKAVWELEITKICWRKISSSSDLFRCAHFFDLILHEEIPNEFFDMCADVIMRRKICQAFEMIQFSSFLIDWEPERN